MTTDLQLFDDNEHMTIIIFCQIMQDIKIILSDPLLLCGSDCFTLDEIRSIIFYKYYGISCTNNQQLYIDRLIYIINSDIMMNKFIKLLRPEERLSPFVYNKEKNTVYLR